MKATVRIGVFGTGFARYGHLPGFHHTPGAEVVAVFSTPLADAQAAANEHGIPHAYDDWERMLAEEQLDLVTIGLPPFQHYPVTMAALAAGCHVLCEKPMALTTDEARVMLAEAERRGLTHMVDHQLRFSPTYRRLKALLEDGFVGQVRHARWHNLGSHRSDPASPWTWLSDRELGGGTFMSGACHAIDLIHWLFGPTHAVSGYLATWLRERPDKATGQPRAVTSDDQYSLHMEMESGVMVGLFGTAVARHQLGMALEIIGSEGTLLMSGDDHLVGGRAGEPLVDMSLPDPNAALSGVATHIWGIAFVSLARELVAALREGRPLREGATFRDGLRTQAVLDAARQAWAERRWVEVASG